ncbi:MAG: hypothetical protein C0404_11315 [Verrucomicrobia bacterium]|nr:hypothetical protein [Verrucomicrobiota bacterium]
MTSLAVWAIASGVTVALLAGPCILAPGVARKMIAGFPRSKIPAWILCFIDVFWVAIIVASLQLGPRYDWVRPVAYILAPVLLIMIVMAMNELLAPRALGFLLLLLPSPIIDAARFHPSELRLVMTALCYVFVVIGIVWVLNPYMFRKMMAMWIKSDNTCRLMGTAHAVLAAVILALAFLVY